MAQSTVTFTALAAERKYTITQLNDLFAAVKAVVDAKLDRRGDTLGATLEGDGFTIINVPSTSDMVAS